MNDEYNKGYNSAGPQRSYDAQQGQFDRREKERQAREASERAAREQRQRDQDRRIKEANQTGTVHGPGGTRSPRPTAPALTWQSSVRDFAGLGALLFTVYSAFTQSQVTGELLFAWAIQGALAGGVAGIVIYAAVLALRLGAAILGFVIKVSAALLLLYIGLLLLQNLR